MTRHYIVRLPTQGEETRMALAAAERTEKRRTIRNGVIAGFLAMATVAAILAAGTAPVRGASGEVIVTVVTQCGSGTPLLEWAVSNRTTASVSAQLYRNGALIRTMGVAVDQDRAGFIGYATAAWIMVTINDEVRYYSRPTPCH